jgi:hypothetical protein
MGAMPAQTPSSLDHLGARPFSFYPPIVGVEHNEWTLLRATWSELLVANTADQREIWVPRSYLGNVSSVDDPVLIVGLLKELEYKAGQVLPLTRRVIEMPKGVPDSYRPPMPELQTAPAAGVDRSPGNESRLGRLILYAVGAALLGCFLLVMIFRTSRDGSHVVYKAVEQSELGLNAADDYHAVIRKLGMPASDRWRSDKGELQYRLLEYPDRGIGVVLMGTERDKAKYIGALDRQWRVVDSVTLHGGNSSGLLKSLNRF